MDRGGEGAGTERQLEDCRELIRSRGWTPAGEYVDNDISAFSGAKRPEFEELLMFLVNGGADTLVVWKSDRLARRGRDLQRFLDTGVTLTSCTEPEFTGSTGLLMLRILSGFAEHESGVKSERVARKMRQKAERGDPHAGGLRSFGFTASGAELVPEEAALLQEAARRILAGETATAVCLDWQRRGISTAHGGRWQPSNISRMLQAHKTAGLRNHKGTISQGSWPAILDLQTWEQLRLKIGSRRRGPQPRKHLLTGLLVCGNCGAQMLGGSVTRGKYLSYRCPGKVAGGCGKTSIVASKVEPYVVRLVLARVPAIRVEADVDVEPMMAALSAAEADLAQLSKDHYVNKLIGRPAYLAANDELETRVEVLRRRISESRSELRGVDLEHVADEWESKSLSWRQSVLRAVLEDAVIQRATSTRTPAAERITLRWKA